MSIGKDLAMNYINGCNANIYDHGSWNGKLMGMVISMELKRWK